MCVIIENTKGVKIDENAIANCITSNSDGFGLFDFDKKEVFKTMDAAIFKEEILSRRKYVAHCRLATHGVQNEDNCHPFYFRHRGSGYYLFHNGIEGSYQSLVGKMKTDSEGIALMLSNLNKRMWVPFLSTLSSKFVVVDEERNHVIKIGRYVDHEGISYSNNSFEDYKPINYYGGYGTNEWAKYWDDQSSLSTREIGRRRVLRSDFMTMRARHIIEEATMVSGYYYEWIEKDKTYGIHRYSHRFSDKELRATFIKRKSVVTYIEKNKRYRTLIEFWDVD